MWINDIPSGLHSWLGEFFPFSFRFNNLDSGQWLDSCRVTSTSRIIDETRGEQTITYVDPATGFEVSCDAIIYRDIPAIEWVLSFHNGGAGDSPILEKVRSLDICLPKPAGNSGFALHAGRGGVYTPEDYEPLEFDLSAIKEVSLSAAGGRSSNCHLPFFLINGGGGGLVVGIGWSGQWCADFATEAEGALHIRADIANTHLRLHPGERIRTARILLLAWEGERVDGHNSLRRLIYRYHTPLLAGEKPLPPVQCNTWFPVGDDGGKANAYNQIELLMAYQPIGIEYMVMDAGWYGTTPKWWDNVGTWVPRIDAFPQGLQPVGEAAERAGIRFGLWFEPERVQQGSKLDIEHPDWLLMAKHEKLIDRLLNLGLPEVQQWFIELVSSYVESVPLGYFRHDFNMNPLPYWMASDDPDRIGMTEIRYIEGLYKIWDELHARFPDLLMEGCASGGRRIDLESISRCHTYWKSDLYANLLANQGHAFGANLFLPGNYLNTPLFDLATDHYARLSLETEYGSQDRNFTDLSENPFAFRSQLGCALCLGYDPRDAGFDQALAIARVQEFKARRHLFVGDFYPLTPYSIEQSQWLGYQFHRVDLGEGVAVLFRRHACTDVEIEFTLRGLSSEDNYEVTFEDTGDTQVIRGSELSQPQRLQIMQAPGSALISYRRRDE